MEFGIYFFASTEESLERRDRYRLITESAKFADQHGFSSIWVPERHFTPFGCLFPNPAVLQAGLATITRQIQLRAGSVVAPLHHPIRIAEEWSVVDNLSGGRVGISLAPGWNPADFAFDPDLYPQRHQRLLETLKLVRQLWSGEKMEGRSGDGRSIAVQIYPLPVQKELPIWITAASNPQTFIQAGELGANLLTHTNDQDVDSLAEKIRLYRAARASQGLDPATGKVTVMVHTFVGKQLEQVLDHARGPYCQFLKTNRELLRGYAFSRGNQLNIHEMTEEDLDEFTQFIFERFARERGLIGTPESCLPLVRKLQEAGVDEIACLLDFGPDSQLILQHLPFLLALKNLAGAEKVSPLNLDQEGQLESVRRRCTKQVERVAFYKRLCSGGLALGNTFRGIQQVWSGEQEQEEVVGLVEWQGTKAAGESLPPALLDACFQLAGSLPAFSNSRSLFLPAGLKGLTFSGVSLPERVWSHLRMLPAGGSPAEFAVEVSIFDENGRLLVHVEQFRLKEIMSIEEEISPESSDYLFQPQWEAFEQESESSGLAVKDSVWLLFQDRQGFGLWFKQYLESEGAEVVDIFPGASLEFSATGAISINPVSTADFQLLWREVANRFQKPVKGIFLWELDQKRQEVPFSQPFASFACLKSLAQDGRRPDFSFWIFTQQGQICLGDEPRVNCFQSAVWGMVKASLTESGDSSMGLIDLGEDLGKIAGAPAIARLLMRNRSEKQWSLRGEKWYRQRLQPARISDSQQAFSPEGLFLITGGTGGLGLACAERLFQLGVSKLALVSRRGPDEEASAIIERLRSNSCEVDVYSADVSDRSQVKRLISQIGEKGIPIKGVFHLAGVLNDRLLVEQEWDEFSGVMAAKAAGAWYLYEELKERAPRYFVLFSSISALFPPPGQSAYAAANAFLDGLGAQMQAEGIPAQVINWGPWAEIGHAATTYGGLAHRQAARQGVLAMNATDALSVLEQLLTSPTARVCAMAIDVRRLREPGNLLSALPLLERLLSSRQVNPGLQTEVSVEIGADWLKGSAVEREEKMTALVVAALCDILKISPQQLTLESVLSQFGLDSLMAIELRNRLQRDLGCAISVVKFLRATTVRQVVAELMTLLPTLEPDPSATLPLTDQANIELEEAREQLADLDQLSEEELEALIQRMSV